MPAAHPSVLDPFYFRFACKSFDPAKTVSDEDFHTILEAGRLSPSSFGLEPWHFLVIQRQSLKDALFPLCWGGQNSLAGASHYVIFLARKKSDLLAGAPYVTHMLGEVHQFPKEALELTRRYYDSFQRKDFQLLESDRALFDWACKQTYIALGNMLTTAAALGVDSCPIEGFQREAVETMLAKKGLLDTAHFGVSVMAGFGCRKGAPAHEKTRQAFDDVVTFVR